jgi:predicted nucleic acid-binding protein
LRFWDSSAVVPLLVEQPASAGCRHIVRTDSTIVVWCLTRIEVLSALQRLRRERTLPDAAIAASERRLTRLAVRWTEVDALVLVRERAERLLRVHALRATDALQLAAALLSVSEQPRGRSFVTLDDALFEAADREGFDTIRPAER